MFQALKKLVGFDKTNETVTAWAHQNQHSPDLWRLMQYQRQWIFIPDDMKMGHRHHKLISEESASGVDPFHPACYTRKNYTLWKKDLGTESFPIAFEESFKPSNFVRWPPEPARIMGELYAIRPSQFILLDNHRQNGVQFIRKRVDISIPYVEARYSKEKPLPVLKDCLHTLQAWMYLGVPQYWDPLLGGVFDTHSLPLYEHETPRIWMKHFYKYDLPNS